MTQQWLDGEEMRAWRGLVEVLADVQADLEAELVEGHGLSEGDYAVFVHLSEAPERRLRMCDLAQRLHLSPSGLTRRLDGLVKLGFVERRPAADDRRVTLAVLTDTGFAAMQAVAPLHVDGVRRHLLHHLNREQLRQLGDAMDAIRAGRAADASAQAEHACADTAANGKPAVAHS